MQIFCVLFHSGFRTLSRYVEASIASVFTSVLFLLVQYFLWKAVSAGNTYGFSELFTYLVFSHIIAAFYPQYLSHRLGSLIRSGDIAFALLRPYPLPLQLVFEELGSSAYLLLFTSLPILIAGEIISGFNLAFCNLLPSICFLALSYVMALLIELLFATLQFVTYSSWGINSLKYTAIMLLSGRILPFDFYPSWALKIVEVLPFRFIYASPLEILSGKTNNGFLQLALFALLWIFLLYICFSLIYRACLRRVIISGG